MSLGSPTEPRAQAAGDSARFGAAFADGFHKVSSIVYTMLIVNLLSLIATAPLTWLILFTDWSSTWLVCALASVLLTPALWAGAACFRAHQDGTTTMVRTYVVAWWQGVRRAGPYALGLAVLVVILLVDVMTVAGTSLAYLTWPIFGIMSVVALATWVVSLTVTEAERDLSRRAALKIGLYAVVRHFPWTLVTLVVLALWVTFFTIQPMLALTVALAPVWYICWSNARHQVNSVTGGLKENR